MGSCPCYFSLGIYSYTSGLGRSITSPLTYWSDCWLAQGAYAGFHQESKTFLVTHEAIDDYFDDIVSYFDMCRGYRIQCEYEDANDVTSEKHSLCSATHLVTSLSYTQGAIQASGQGASLVSTETHHRIVNVDVPWPQGVIDNSMWNSLLHWPYNPDSQSDQYMEMEYIQLRIK